MILDLTLSFDPELSLIDMGRLMGDPKVFPISTLALSAYSSLDEYYLKSLLDYVQPSATL